MKVMTILGTRPEIIRLSRVIARLDAHTRHVLVHTGQNYDYELNQVFFEELGVRAPDHFLNCAGGTLAETIGAIIAKSDEVLAREKPDAMLVLGDTNSALSVIPAKRRRIPIFHMEAGNRCFDMRVPEEINRRIVDHVSDINLPYTEHARRYLLAEGLSADKIICTGSPLREVLMHYRGAIDRSIILQRLAVEKGGYFAASLHREENVDSPDRLRRLVEVLNAVAAKYDRPVIFSTHPRTRDRLAKAGLSLDARVRSMPPLGFPDYVALEMNAYCTISDSGTITEEAAILGFPAITVREAHERPEGMDEGILVMADLQMDRVCDAIECVVAQIRESGPPRPPADYIAEQVSWKVLKIIQSYTGYVNRTVWSQST